MRCTDLQINDWVYLSEKSRYPMRVTEIDKYNCLLDFEGNEADPFEGYFDENGIVPIELTDRMVELNESTCNYIEIVSTYSPKYVHELQHLLRLYGLHDMADNFKIK